MFLISTGCGTAVDRCTELQYATKLHIFFSRDKQYFFTGYLTDIVVVIFLVSTAE